MSGNNTLLIGWQLQHQQQYTVADLTGNNPLLLHTWATIGITIIHIHHPHPHTDHHHPHTNHHHPHASHIHPSTDTNRHPKRYTKTSQESLAPSALGSPQPTITGVLIKKTTHEPNNLLPPSTPHQHHHLLPINQYPWLPRRSLIT